jgi:hypothetical protein
MKVTQLINNNGNPAVNQFVITDGNKEIFQSYETKIAVVERGKIIIDTRAMDYSKTTSKHLYMFLGMDRKRIESGVKDGEILVQELN